MTTKYGFFREEDKISTRLGDPYTDLLAVKDDRNKGLNMVAPVGKKGWVRPK